MQPRLPSFQEFERRSLNSIPMAAKSMKPFRSSMEIPRKENEVRLIAGYNTNSTGVTTYASRGFYKTKHPAELSGQPMSSLYNPASKNNMSTLQGGLGGHVQTRMSTSPRSSSSSMRLSSTSSRRSSASRLSSSTSRSSTSSQRTSVGVRYCNALDCPKQAQTGGFCKIHGGGRRCTHAGCGKSSQSGGLCRRHGGGKLCTVEGCTRGPQRGGVCHMVSIQNKDYIKKMNINEVFCSMEGKSCVK